MGFVFRRNADFVAEPAGLGRLAALLQALRSEYQPRSQPPVIREANTGTPPSSTMVSPSDGEEDENAPPRSAWSMSDQATYSESDDDFGNPIPGQEAITEPSLAYLDNVLGFLPAEREKLQPRATTQRGGFSSQSQASTSDNARKYVIGPR